YISRYMKRGPIALNRIIMYDGDQVMFHYKDKRTNRTETKTMTAEEFIGAMTRQIQNHHFRTIRRYGIYSRRLKNLMKTILQAYQSQVKKMIIAVKNALKPKKWAERLTEEFGENPLECSKCGEKEDIPKSVVDLLDGTDLEYEPNQPPQFSCEKCGGEMYPEYYRNGLGKEFRFSEQ
ncbi:transposase, partial [Enterococcus nangangensis]|uniref:transposase n=1 Tax=Enterococcus nangangensis TaxID=2559926 RepID=UPI001FE3615D